MASLIYVDKIQIRVVVELNVYMTRNFNCKWHEEKIVMVPSCDQECFWGSRVGALVKLNTILGLANDNSLIDRDPFMEKCIHTEH